MVVTAGCLTRRACGSSVWTNADCGPSVARIAWIGVAAGASGWLLLDLEEAEIGARRRGTG